MPSHTLQVKRFIVFILLSAGLHSASTGLFAQAVGREKLDSLIMRLKVNQHDTDRINLLNDIAYDYSYIEPDSGLIYGKQAVELAEQVGNQRLLSEAHNTLGINYQTKSEFSRALEEHFKALKIREENDLKVDAATSMCNIGILYDNQHDYDKALEYYRKAMGIFKDAHYKKGFATATGNISLVYYAIGDYPKAKMFVNEAIKLESELRDSAAMTVFIGNLGNIYLAEKDFEKALECDNRALASYRRLGDRGGEAINLCNIGEIYYQIAKDDDKNTLEKLFNNSKAKALEASVEKLSEAKAIFSDMGFLSGLQEVYKYMSLVSDLQGNKKAALEFLRLENAYKDSIFNEENRSRLDKLERERNKDLQKKEIEIQKLQLEKAENERRFYIGGILLLLLLIFVLYNRFRLKKKSSEKLSESLERIRQTQAQLVEQEKLASLGQLTSGIAHEIQNPLNFVNNFSEVSSELVDELLSATDEGERKLIADDLKKNLSIINQHGKRADGIVKGMLMHSRGGKGEMVPTDLNAMIAETLNLSFHAMRAKHPGFNCELVTHYDPDLPQVKVNQLDISRVILNLLNNAFYAVKSRKGENDSDPTMPAKVTISTRLNQSEAGKSAVITIRDNGTGIPKDIITNIFTPFFTTKPGGEGTGLGLSISRDIIKAHGGEIKVGSEMGRYTEFVIVLPL